MGVSQPLPSAHQAICLNLTTIQLEGFHWHGWHQCACGSLFFALPPSCILKHDLSPLSVLPSILISSPLLSFLHTVVSSAHHLICHFYCFSPFFKHGSFLPHSPVILLSFSDCAPPSPPPPSFPQYFLSVTPL